MLVLIFGTGIVSAEPTRLESLLVKAEAIRSGDPVGFRILLKEINSLKKQADAKQRLQIDYLNAYSLTFAGRFDDAISSAQKLLDSNNPLDIRIRAGALIVNNYAGTRQFTDGLRQLEQTLLLSAQTEENHLKVHVSVAAAIIYNQIGQYELASDYAKQVLDTSDVARERCFAEFLASEANFHLKKLPREDQQLNDLISRCVAAKETVIANLSRQLLAEKWASEGNRKKAIGLLRSHIEEIEGTRYPRLVGEVHALLARYLLEEHDIDGAEHHANQAASQSASVVFSSPLVGAYKTLYEIARKRGNTEEALLQFQRYAEADKAYMNEAKARELAYQVVRQETLQKSQQIDQLDQKNQLLQLQSRLDQQSAQNTRLLVLLLVVVIASIGYWAYKIKRVQLSLKKLAETDALTEVCNRHNFTLLAERSLAQCARAGEEAALIMFDLDHFKQINDRYGHQTGDWALKQVALVCQGFCRRIDTLGRLGGEEFAFLMHGCDTRNARRLAEDCRVRIASIDTRETGFVFSITASFGVTTTAVSGYSLAKLLSHADKALYRAKHLGRNRVCGTDDAPVVAHLHEPHENAVLQEVEDAPVAMRLERAGS